MTKCIVNGILGQDVQLDDWKIKGNTYEVIRVIDDKPMFLKEHLVRLENSNSQIDSTLVERDINMLLESIPEKVNDNLFISVNPMKRERAIFIIKGFYPPAGWYEEGIRINTCKIVRDNPTLKIYDQDYKKKIEEHLKTTQVFETLITDGILINEGSRSNVFFIKDSVIFTPMSNAVLPGITRAKVFEAAKVCNIDIIETDIYLKDLKSYDGSFITGTSIDLLPVSEIDEIRYGTVENRTFIDLMNEFRNIKNKDLEAYNAG